jgi:hypothetical protein
MELKPAICYSQGRLSAHFNRLSSTQCCVHYFFFYFPHCWLQATIEWAVHAFINLLWILFPSLQKRACNHHCLLSLIPNQTLCKCRYQTAVLSCVLFSVFTWSLNSSSSHRSSFTGNRRQFTSYNRIIVTWRHLLLLLILILYFPSRWK